MEFTTILLGSLGALVVQIPLYIVYGVGLALAFTRWNKHPRVSLLAAIAYSASIVISIILTIIQVSLPYQMAAQEVGAVYSILGICGNLIHAALAAVLVAAVFGWRKADEAATS
jgi:hypothetical protein